MWRSRTRRRGAPAAPDPDPMRELERLADSTVALAEQIRATVAELRRQDTRGDVNE